MKTISTKIIYILLLLSLVVRIIIAFYTPVGIDELNFYKTGLPFYNDFTILPRGQIIVYTGAHIPGSLQPIVLGLLMFLSKGAFWILPIFMAVLNTLGVFVLYRVLEKYLFPNFDKLILAVFIFFSPWSVITMSAWNPSVLPFLMSLFYLGLIRYLKGEKDFLTSFLIFSTLFAAYQFHLGTILIVAILFLVIFMKRNPMNLLGAIIGSVCVGVFYIPLFFAEPENIKKSVLVFNIENIRFAFKILLRLTSFVTAELSHFFSKGRILHLPYMDKNIFSITLFVFSLATSLFLTVLTLRFYSKKRITTSFKNLINFNKVENEYQILDTIGVLIPLITASAFIFSIKGPSTHTFWILFPFSFYPLLKVLSEKEFFFNKFPKKKQILFLSIYTVLVVSYSIYGMVNLNRVSPTMIEYTLNSH